MNEHDIRQKKLASLRDNGFDFPNTFSRTHTIQAIIDSTHTLTETLAIGGRIRAIRHMGKTCFLTLQDGTGALQLYANHTLGATYTALLSWDLGDIIGVQGTVFHTKSGERSLRLTQAMLLVKAIRPLPDKHHGLTDVETRYRQRYLDWLVNPEAARIIRVRSATFQALRTALTQRSFMEVETPMMHDQPGGAQAKPFITHHHALQQSLFLRIAPELYLKKMIIGGFEKIFEINRNFRNEGVSTRHHPEFTMLEFYEAFSDRLGAQHTLTAILQETIQHICGTLQITYKDHTLDFSHFQVEPMAHAVARVLNVPLTQVVQTSQALPSSPANPDEALVYAFEKHVEPTLIQPTFIIDYPLSVSPLSKRHPEHPHLADRFELFVAGRELANGFSELNDPDEQRQRFQQQIHTEDAMSVDETYLTAMAYGLPPTGGCGLGIDRFIMLLTNVDSIREVIAFPYLKRV
jgi:lysyl-tRNA synthetase, class II